MGVYNGLAKGCLKQGAAMTDFYRWWIVDEVTGERVLTPYKLTCAHAALAFPNAEPELRTLEVRELPNIGPSPWRNTRPGEPWVDSRPGSPWVDTRPSR